MARNLMRLLRDPDLTNGQFGKHLESEDATGLVRQIVEIANSAFYCSRVPIRTLSDAISRIGRRQLYDVVMMAAVGTLYASPHNALRAHWDHSIASGVIGYALAEELGLGCETEAFKAGLIHDIGKVLLFRKYPGVFKYLSYREEVLKRLWWEVEEERFPGLAHAPIGARVAERWGFPDAVIEAIRHHHMLEGPAPQTLAWPPLTCVVSLASIIADNFNLGHPHYGWNDVLGMTCARGLGFTLEHLAKVRARASLLFSIGGGVSIIGVGVGLGAQEAKPGVSAADKGSANATGGIRAEYG